MALSSVFAQPVPDVLFPPQIEGNVVTSSAAGFTVTFPGPPHPHATMLPTYERAVYACELSHFGGWEAALVFQRFAVHFHHLEPTQRILYRGLERTLRSGGIEEFTHEFILGENAVVVRGFGVHPNTGRYHAAQVVMARYRLLIQNVIHSGSVFAQMQTLTFFDSLEVGPGDPAWLGPIEQTLDGRYTVDLLGIELMDRVSPGAGAALVAGLSQDNGPGRAKRHVGGYSKPPLDELQRTRLAVVHAVLSEFAPGELDDYEHDLRITREDVEYRMRVWEHFVTAYFGLLPGIDRDDPQQRRYLYNLIVIASQNPPKYRSHFSDEIAFAPAQRDRLFAAYDEQFAASRPDFTATPLRRDR